MTVTINIDNIKFFEIEVQTYDKDAALKIAIAHLEQHTGRLVI